MRRSDELRAAIESEYSIVGVADHRRRDLPDG
jgi:hypothetical protein